MYESACQKFIQRIHEILNNPLDFPESNNYLKLDEINDISYDLLNEKANNLPPADPLKDAFNLILRQARVLHLDNLLLGLNELLKAYLKNINQKNQQQISDRVLQRIQLIFLFITKENFPYTEEVWESLSASAKPVGLFLLKNNFPEATKLYFEFMASMGKQAARKNLSTRTLQHVFRAWENAAQSQHWEKIASHARHLRQNLES